MKNAKYCESCGYINTEWNEENCPFCKSKLKTTEESYEELLSNTEDASIIPEYIRQMYVYCSDFFDENKYDYMKVHYKPSKIICPKCGSDQIQITKRGLNIIWGVIGAGNNERVCLNCMYKF